MRFMLDICDLIMYGSYMMNKKRNALINDDKLWAIARYHVDKGTMKKPDMQKWTKRFNEFKALVKRGSFTIDQLEDRVYEKFGVLDEDAYDKSLREAKEVELEMKYEQTRQARKKTNEQKQK